MVWPRQYGKTYQIEQWWLENPQNRAIVTSNEQDAREIRHRLTGKLMCASSTFAEMFEVELKKLLEQRVMSWRSWGNIRGERWVTTAEVAVDETGAVLQGLLHANVTIVAGAGKNDEPDPERAAQVRNFHEQHGMNPDE
jgi:hypothetical protein